MLTEVEKAYIAGVIDSDGCIHIEKYQSKRKGRMLTYTPRVQIANTCFNMLEWVSEKLTGKCRKYIYSGKSKNQCSKPVYIWKISGRNAIELCKLIKPYLIIKKPRAQIVIDFEDTLFDNRARKTGCFTSIPRELLEKKEELYQQLKILNRRGVCVPGTRQNRKEQHH